MFRYSINSFANLLDRFGTYIGSTLQIGDRQCDIGVKYGVTFRVFPYKFLWRNLKLNLHTLSDFIE
jgi:hypothetical protein